MKDTISLATFEYSENEKKLIKYFGLDGFAYLIAPPELFRMMGYKSFIMNDNSPYSDALRKACKELFKSDPMYRATPEWEELIKVDEPVERTS